jgi:hypothetical protein
MPIPAATIATFAPWGNAQLAFTVSGDGALTTDPATGDPMPSVSTLEYLAHVTIGQPDWQKAEGVDQSLYTCRGRLLDPQVFDPRITNGSQGPALVNGLRGRFELTFDLAMGRAEAPSIGQSFKGTFRVTGPG